MNRVVIIVVGWGEGRINRHFSYLVSFLVSLEIKSLTLSQKPRAKGN